MDGFIMALIASEKAKFISEENNIYAGLIGNWYCVMTYYPDTEKEFKIDGNWYFSWIINGEAIQDVFVTPNNDISCNWKSNEISVFGTSLRVYNKLKQCWEVFSSCNGSSLVSDSIKIGDKIVSDAISVNKYKMKRIFHHIEENSFKWQMAVSADNGKSWVVHADLIAKRVENNN